MYKKQIKGWIKHGDFMILDMIAMQLCYVLAFFIVKGPFNPYRIVLYRYQAVLLFFCQVMMDLFTSSYKNILRRSRFREFVCVIQYAIGVLLIALAYLFLMHQTLMLSRLHWGITFVLYVFVSFALRLLNKYRIYRRASSESEAGKRSIVVITSSALADEVIKNLSDNSYHDYFISAIVLMDQETPDVPEIDGVKTLGSADHLLEKISRDWVDEVFLYQPDDMSFPNDFIEELLTMGMTVHYSMAAFNSTAKGREQEVNKLGNYKVLTTSMHFISIQQMAIKRFFDILGGLIGCAITGIIFIFVAPAIYRKSPGPIFFTQERIGRNGKPFKMYKFRSMYMDAEERKAALMKENKITDGMMFKMDDDPRIIGSEKKDKNGKPKGIGNFIRNTSLDEFPQFWNVLKGDMSLVGTRPPTVDEWNKYDLHHRARMSIKPGITGMWQVSGRSKITDFEEVVRLDREYIENWSIELDIKILFKTIAVVFKHEGAE